MPDDPYVCVVEVDARNLSCPMPLLRARQALKSVQSGEIIKVLATDAGSWKDFQSFSNHSGDKLLKKLEHNSAYTYWLQKK